MSPRTLSLTLTLLAISTCLGSAPAQGEKHIAYPEKDALTPFRTPAEIYAPPDQLYSLLRRMRAMAADPAYQRTVDSKGREKVESETWLDMRNEAVRVGLDAGYLASIIRMSRNDDDRRTAFYAMFYCDRVDYVFNLISHIPGEPLRSIRQEAFPRAIDYLHAHLSRRFGDLTDEQKNSILSGLPEPGSPAAKAKGITRAPRDDDALYNLRLKPFFQLLDVDNALDQAQALWFLKEVFTIQERLALQWLEPALPRIEQLLVGDDAEVRKQAIALLQVIGPDDLPAIAKDATSAELISWADRATKAMFPPIRNVNDALIQLFPSAERDAIVAAGLEGLRGAGIGDPFRGKNADGQYYSGFRVARVPEALEPLAIPKGAVITTVNGVAVMNAESLLKAVQSLLDNLPKPQALLVEYTFESKAAAVEYRIM